MGKDGFILITLIYLQVRIIENFNLATLLKGL